MDTGGTARTDLELAFLDAVHAPNLQVPSTQSHSGPFDWIVLDTSPAQTLFTRLALAAAHYVVVPAVVEPFAARGVSRVIDTATAMRALCGETPKIVGCVITKWKSTATTRAELPTLQTELDAKHIDLFEVQVALDDKIDQAHLSTIGGGSKILFGFGGSPAARDYEKLLSQLLEKVRPNVNEPS